MLERFFILLPDSSETYQAWRGLVVQYQVSGAKVHDAYLVAAMLAHQVTALLTLNGGDFARYDAIQILDPRHLARRSPAANI